MTDFRIRRAEEADFPSLLDIEVDAASLFAEFGLAPLAAMPPVPASFYAALSSASALFVAESAQGLLAGFAVGKPLGQEGYLREVSVRRAYAGQGIGRSLVEAVIAWARESGYPSLSLTTFRDLPFNAPFYAKLGFAILPPENCSQALRRIREEEDQDILGLAPRVAMRLEMKQP